MKALTNSKFSNHSLYLLAFIPLLFIMSGCQHYQATEEVDAAQSYPVNTRDPFLKALHNYYASYAKSELDKEQDYNDAIRFARKSMDAGDSLSVYPVELADWVLTANVMPELQMGRIRLTQLFFLKAKTKYPDKTAKAQFYYDCWVEEQEEAGGRPVESSCKTGFYKLIEDLENDLLKSPAKPAAKVETKKTEPLNKNKAKQNQNLNTVFFEFDKSVLTDESKERLSKIVGEIKDSGKRRVTVRGHTDTVGTPGYNNTLSLNRALTVREKLIKLGIPESQVFIDWKGESKNMQDMGDGEKTRLNRRVDIIF